MTSTLTSSVTDRSLRNVLINLLDLKSQDLVISVTPEPNETVGNAETQRAADHEKVVAIQGGLKASEETKRRECHRSERGCNRNLRQAPFVCSSAPQLRFVLGHSSKDRRSRGLRNARSMSLRNAMDQQSFERGVIH